MQILIDWLWMRAWWSYADAKDPLYAVIYRSINVVEGSFWLGFAVFVLFRRARQPRGKRTGLELCYAAAFFCFALTDFREAFALHSWLIWVKAVNLVVLLWLRQRVIREIYPGEKF